MLLFQELINTIQDGKIIEVRIGLHWTTVVVEVSGQRRCGLAATLFEHQKHDHTPTVPQAGDLEHSTGRELAELVFNDQPTLVSVGMATINALLPHYQDGFIDANAEEIIVQYGSDKKVVLVGHFPFVPHLRSRVRDLVVLEQKPEPGDIPAENAESEIPEAQLVAITGMTLVNGTLESLLKLCSPGTFVMLLGPSTPLSQVMFNHGVNLLSGSLVTDIDPVVRAITQGANFRQLHQIGVRLVNMERK